METQRSFPEARRLALGALTLTATLTSAALMAALTILAPSALSARAVPNALARPLPVDTAAAPVRLPPLLSVTNDNWLDVHVYLVRDGEPFSLGVVTGPGESVLDLPSLATTPGAKVQLLVLPIGGTADYLSPDVTVNPGDVVRLDIANALPMSSVSVDPTATVSRRPPPPPSAPAYRW